MKCLLSVSMAVILIFAMALPSFAAESYTVSGVWVFNETLSWPSSNILQKVNFVSSGENYFGFYVGYCSALSYDEDGDDSWYQYYSNGWNRGSGYRTVDFGSTPQTVSQEFYDWLSTHAVPPKCDGTDCPSTDANKNNICDDCGFEFAVLRDYSPFSVKKFMNNVGQIFTSAISWVGDVGSTILQQPLLLAFCALPLCGIGIGIFKRLKTAS